MVTVLRFENVDIVATLAAVTQANTRHYQGDFEYDKAVFIRAAQDPTMDDKEFLWLSRRSGTVCVHEREAFIRGSDEHTLWLHYKDTQDSIVAFAVEIQAFRNGRPYGALYEQDYRSHAERVERKAFPAEAVTLTFEDGTVRRFPFSRVSDNWRGVLDTYGNIVKRRYEVRDEWELFAMLSAEGDARRELRPRSVGAYLERLAEGGGVAVREAGGVSVRDRRLRGDGGR